MNKFDFFFKKKKQNVLLCQIKFSLTFNKQKINLNIRIKSLRKLKFAILERLE